MTADLAHHRDARERVGELVAQPRPALRRTRSTSRFALQRVDHGEPDRARQRRAVPRVAEREPARARGDRLVDVVVADHRADRRVAGAQPLGGGDDVGGERQLLGRKPVAGAADAGDHLVEADQKAVPVAALGEPFPEALRGHVGRQRGGADRLAEERRHVLGPDLARAPGRAPRAPARRWGRSATCSAGCAAARAGTGSDGPCSPGRPVSASVAIVGPW